MFKLNSELINKIKQAIVPTNLVPAEGIFVRDCFGCSSECVSSCRGGCWGNCSGGCIGSCSGSTR
ncbi:MAG: hypothetical protein IJF76_03665 [Clostridia bacterium]|nr:hypothetical protein [Clostridia bacterium]